MICQEVIICLIPRQVEGISHKVQLVQDTKHCVTNLPKVSDIHTQLGGYLNYVVESLFVPVIKVSEEFVLVIILERDQ